MPKVPRPLHRLAHGAEQRWDDLRYRFTRRTGRDDPVQIVPFRGYGTAETLRLRGRVLENEVAASAVGDSLWRNLHRMYKRYESDEVPGARLRARHGEHELEVEGDAEGYFELEIPTDGAGDDGDGSGDALWREVELELLAPDTGRRIEAVGEVIVPPPDARLAVVSDVDDTIVHTGAQSFLRMSRILLANNAHTRVPFHGVGAFYRALQRGDAERPTNPIFYVSSSPWNVYDLFLEFLEVHDIPPGPFFLKDFGLDSSKLFKSGHASHKSDWIAKLLATYPDLRFLLIGDSGQHDPEIYHQVTRENPERFLAVYIRDVSDERRRGAIRELAAEVDDVGVPMLLVEDTVAAARHAADAGWISTAAVDEIRSERDDDDRHDADGGRGLLARLLG